jgi:hypothetical protein
VTNRRPSGKLSELLERLWTERGLLERLLFELVSAKLILEADAGRFVPPAAADIELARERIGGAELMRAVAVAEIAEHWGLPAQRLSLRFLARHAPEPADRLFEDHHRAFLELAEEIQVAAREGRRLATAALATVRRREGVVVDACEDGAVTVAPHFQELAYEQALEALAHALQPSLLDFLA